MNGAMNGMSADDFLWVIQRNVILDLAEKGPCVIVTGLTNLRPENAKG